MSKKHSEQPSVVLRIIGDDSQIQKYPIINRIISIYVGLVLLCFTLYTIAPFVTIIGKTPLYSSKTYLGILGGLLLCMDLFTNKGLWRGPYVIWLYALAAVSVVSSLITMRYGVKQNLFMICWVAVQFALVYSCCCRMDRESFGRYVHRIFYTLLGIWAVACAVSIGQYLLQIGYRYVADPRSDDASLVRQGFYKSRLFGIFNPLNHAAYVSLMLLLGNIYYFLKEKQVWKRVLLILADVMLLLHIILSGSRSALVSLTLCVFIGAWCVGWSKCKRSVTVKIAVACAGAILAAAVFVPTYQAFKTGVGKLPALVEKITYSDLQTPTEPEENAPGQELPGSDLMEREELEGNVSNDRFRIWKDYLGLVKDIGLVGLSPGNYMMYVRDRYPDLFIVQYVRDNFPEKFEAGVIYHVHNGYLMVLVSTGIVGFLFLGVYLVLCLIKCLTYIARHPVLSAEFTVLLMIAASGVVSAFFDKGIFFMDSAPTFYFWFALGILMKMVCSTTNNNSKQSATL